ncbi:MAG: hypothetical protein LBT13_08310 [Treponema sp.]|jgi:hypothetical protein|nr:hypothetical protein [Treponema sp.]
MKIKNTDRTRLQKNPKISIERLNNKEMVFSFKDFDHTQGQTFLVWEENKLLHLLLEKMKEYSHKTLIDAQKAYFTIYGSFPTNSQFKYPRHISEDAIWASLHIQGKECIIGHIIDNIFYTVFLDKEHQFWPTEKKHT